MKCFKPQTNNYTPVNISPLSERVLVFTRNWLGDVVCETPALRVIRDNYPQAALVCVTTPRCREILERNPHVDQVLTFDERCPDRALGAKWRFIREVRERRFTKAYLFHRSWTRAFLLAVGGIQERIGFSTKGRGMLLTTAVSEPREPLHRVQYFLHLLRASGLRVEDNVRCEFYFTKEDAEKSEQLLRQHNVNGQPFIVLNPGANRANKRWPPAQFAALADQIARQHETAIVITGAQQDELCARHILASTSAAHPVSLCGATDLGMLGALFAKAQLVVSGDSGPMHIAAGVGAPLVALFGPTDPAITGPYGAGPTLVVQSTQRSMTSIDPMDVYAQMTRKGLFATCHS